MIGEEINKEIKINHINQIIMDKETNMKNIKKDRYLYNKNKKSLNLLLDQEVENAGLKLLYT